MVDGDGQANLLTHTCSCLSVIAAVLQLQVQVDEAESYQGPQARLPVCAIRGHCKAQADT